MARIDHPNVVRMFGTVRDGEHLGFTLELVKGLPLTSLIEAGQPLSFAEVLGVLIQVCRGVGAIHERGVIHRDLKPDNILVTETGLCKIIDFGVARLLGKSGSLFRGSSSLDSEIGGTLDFLAPVLFLGGETGPASDVYSIGVIGYWLVSGRVPFAGKTLREAVRFKAYVQPGLPHAMAGGLSARPRARHHPCAIPRPFAAPSDTRGHAGRPTCLRLREIRLQGTPQPGGAGFPAEAPCRTGTLWKGDRGR